MGVDGLTFSLLISHDSSQAAPPPTGVKYDLFQFYYRRHKQTDTNRDNAVAPLKKILFHFNLYPVITVTEDNQMEQDLFYLSWFSGVFYFTLPSNTFCGSWPQCYSPWVRTNKAPNLLPRLLWMIVKIEADLSFHPATHAVICKKTFGLLLRQHRQNNGRLRKTNRFALENYSMFSWENFTKKRRQSVRFK